MTDNEMRFTAIFIVFSFFFIFYDGCRRQKAQVKKCKNAGGELVVFRNHYYPLCISNKFVLPIEGE